MLDSEAISKMKWKALKQEHKRPWKNSERKQKMGDEEKIDIIYLSFAA